MYAKYVGKVLKVMVLIRDEKSLGQKALERMPALMAKSFRVLCGILWYFGNSPDELFSNLDFCISMIVEFLVLFSIISVLF